MNNQTNPITATAVIEDKRLSVLPRFFGVGQMLRAEAIVFGYMSKLSIDYTGGHWEYYLLSNGGFYMAPSMDIPMRVEWHGNGYEGTMSADAAGIVATMFAVGQMVHEQQTNAMADLYHQIRDFALGHPEAQKILAAID